MHLRCTRNRKTTGCVQNGKVVVYKSRDILLRLYEYKIYIILYYIIIYICQDALGPCRGWPLGYLLGLQYREAQAQP